MLEKQKYFKKLNVGEIEILKKYTNVGEIEIFKKKKMEKQKYF